MGMMTTEALYDYMVAISEEIDDRLGSGYHSDEQREEIVRATYDLLVESEEEEERLAYVEDGTLAETIDMLKDENFHAEAAALIAYMHNIYNWDGGYSIEDQIECFPYLYSD